MTVRELYNYLSEKIPSELSCEWDNDGLMCCPAPDREVRKVLVTLDVSEEMVELAIESKCDVILSHHPLVFKPIKSLTTDGGVSAKLIRLVENKIAVMSFHTRLDALCGGVNDALAAAIGLKDTEPFGEEGETLGRVGYTTETILEKFAENVKGALGSPMVLYSGSRPVRKVAVLGGNGDDFIFAAKACGADTLVSGRLGYHAMADAAENGINLIEAGHYYTEAPVLPYLAKMVLELDKSTEILFADSNNIRAV